MLIAFEGPDNTGKSTTAADLASSGQAVYNATKDNYRALRADMAEPGAESLVATFDRIDWLTHMMYRLAMPDRDWADERPRTVFAMPDTHLVVNLHARQTVAAVEDELYESGSLPPVNEMYRDYVEWLIAVNYSRGYSLFKSITVTEVAIDQQADTFRRTLLSHDSAGLDWGNVGPLQMLPIEKNWQLLEVLRYAEQQADR